MFSSALRFMNTQQCLIPGHSLYIGVSERFIPGEYAVAMILLSFGLLLEYICAITFGGWLDSSNALTLVLSITCGFGAVFFIMIGLTGFLIRYDRQTRILDDRIIVPSEYRFDKSETEIPLGRVWRLYSNLKNDFPAVFVVWRDDRERCRCTRFDKAELPDFPSEVARLGERIPVDTDSYAVADLVRKQVRANLGCEPAW
jgi:hypothetical protein